MNFWPFKKKAIKRASLLAAEEQIAQQIDKDVDPIAHVLCVGAGYNRPSDAYRDTPVFKEGAEELAGQLELLWELKAKLKASQDEVETFRQSLKQ